MEAIGLVVAQRDQGIVLDGREVGPDLGWHVIVEVGRGDGDHLDIDPQAVHVG